MSFSGFHATETSNQMKLLENNSAAREIDSYVNLTLGVTSGHSWSYSECLEKKN